MADFTYDLAAWLLGPDARGYPPATTPLPAPAGAGGILQRLLTWFPGGPTGPNEHLAALGAATGLHPPPAAMSALIVISGAATVLSLDGTPAGAANGLPLPVGTIMRLCGIDCLRAASFVQVAAGAVVDVAYFT